MEIRAALNEATNPKCPDFSAKQCSEIEHSSVPLFEGEVAMKRAIACWLLAVQMSCAMWCLAAPADSDVPWRAQAEIARRGAMVERVDGIADAGDPTSAIALAMQPPE